MSIYVQHLGDHDKDVAIIHIHDSICIEYIIVLWVLLLNFTNISFPLTTNTQLLAYTFNYLFLYIFWYLSCFVSRKFYGFEDRNMTFYNFTYIFLSTLCNFNAHNLSLHNMHLRIRFAECTYKIYDHIGGIVWVKFK